ncbi:circadian-associated transcriptional repressor-like [Myxocyprinus asiaticus]|uniref:circadian-associated transcriptional repressor-like n=1 Tax=Myxocyprinus asiaticus TaxID=70543 RepID=UPI002223927B|nr:circadian-associated transcriptional repressor-like [Myxocyprinus asiaticus]XP_051577470.1 circadian-associated transcriptional repressor-like [Myxocyprinus asiaticus]XP_051577471.1 circadian-associated transcriptional repressor-like [Myxocyprinus asiaticus]
MQSTGSTSSQPSQDSLSSRDSFLFSEDNPDVFLLEDRDMTRVSRSAQSNSSRGSLYSVDGELERPGSQWACDGFSESRYSERSEDNGQDRSSFLSLSSSTSSGLVWSCSESERGKDGGGSEGDLLFARKCTELQGFVRPLLELLNGLKKGRFDKGLSSFQQSVAMDRIQRIVGVLQKPHSGEKYLPTLLQIEVMLKLWFPQVISQASVTPNPADLSLQNNSSHGSSKITPPHKHKDQLHIPVKKRRLSWSDTDSPSSSPLVVCKRSKIKCCKEQHQWSYVDGGEGSSGASPHSSHTNQSEKRVGETSAHKAIRWSGSSLTWVQFAPIFSPPKSGPSHKGGAAKERGSGYVPLPVSPVTSRISPAMQDSSISSTTPFSEPNGCQSQPVTLGNASPLQGCTQTPPITMKPSSLVEQQSPLQT